MHRGRHSFAVAKMTDNAIPLDTELLRRVLDNWNEIRLTIIAERDTFGVYEDGHFREDRFLDLVDERGIDWPKTAVAGRPVLEAKTAMTMVTHYPELKPLFELRATLAELSLDKLNVGADGRNRSPLFPFSTKTGRSAFAWNVASRLPGAGPLRSSAVVVYFGAVGLPEPNVEAVTTHPASRDSKAPAVFGIRLSSTATIWCSPR